ncbi:hypothetical protein [Algoriphagus namhaensis]
MKGRVKGLLFFTFILSLVLIFNGCRQFIDDSFDTVLARMVDESGNALAGVELIFTDNVDFLDSQRLQSNSFLYKVTTDARGEVKFVVPSKNLDPIYFIEIQSPFLAEIDVFGEVEPRNYLRVDLTLRNEFGVVDLGIIKLIKR